MAEEPNQGKAGQRIAKVIARAGLASRREAEAWIAAGRVAVNGTVIASPAIDVTGADRITVDSEPLPARQRTRLFLYHKPRGLMTTHADPQGRPTIFQNLPHDLPRLISVGRLDFNTEGLLLLSNDGALARLLELPATGWLRRYRVRAHGSVTQDRLDGLRRGVTIEGMNYGPIEAALDRVQGSNLWLTLGIREGKNREVRNVLGHLGLKVTRLIRISFGPFQLGELREGEVEEVRTRVLREQLGEKLARLSGADFSAPSPAPSPESRPKPPRKPSQDQTRAHEKPAVTQHNRQHKAKNRVSSDHAWRAHEEGRPTKKMRRRFHGARRDRQAIPERNERVQSDTLTDRKGRAVAVERYPRKSPPDALGQDSRGRDSRGRDSRSQGERGFRRKSAHHRRDRSARRSSRAPPRRPRDKS
jgi:23S rRNA pseudouridine2605 synthase